MNLIAAAAIFFLMFVGVFQIIGRTVFNTAIHGYIDYMEQARALFAFLGISYAQRVGAHIRMDRPPLLTMMSGGETASVFDLPTAGQ